MLQQFVAAVLGLAAQAHHTQSAHFGESRDLVISLLARYRHLLANRAEKVRVLLVHHLVRFFLVDREVERSVPLLCNMVLISHSIVEWTLLLHQFTFGKDRVWSKAHFTEYRSAWHPKKFDGQL